MLFKQFCFALLCNESNIADREGQWILQLQMITGVRDNIVFFIVATLIKDVLFEQFLMCNGVNIADKEL